MPLRGPKIARSQSQSVTVSLKTGAGAVFAPQSGPSSRRPDRRKPAVLSGPKTQRSDQNAILVNIAHILQLQHPTSDPLTDIGR